MRSKCKELLLVGEEPRQLSWLQDMGVPCTSAPASNGRLLHIQCDLVFHLRL
jgi:hypothetical protein